MDKVLFRLGELDVTVEVALWGAAGLIAALLLTLLVVVLRANRARTEEAVERAQASLLADQRAREAERHLAEVMQRQAEMSGRMQTMAEIFTTRQADFARLVSERLDSQSQRVGQAIEATQKKSEDSLSKLGERLAVIDRAQANITALSQDVVSLQSILANKQTRGAFGQARMEAIVADGLPPGAFAFQATLANGNRPDCLIFMPNGAPPLVVDAKFPLESYNAIRAADGNEPALKAAVANFRRDMDVHIRAIAEKYLVQGETQDTAFLFVPSESVFAEIHEHHEALVQRAHRARIVIVSPSLLMLSIQVVQAVLKDARMREQAHIIQGEVARLMADLGRLDDRVRKLQGHFQQTTKDVEEILISTAKVTRHGQRIEALEFGEPPAEPAARGAEPRSAESRTGQLRLKVVDEE